MHPVGKAQTSNLALCMGLKLQLIGGRGSIFAISFSTLLMSASAAIAARCVRALVELLKVKPEA
jgi:hypothetical protein